MTRKMQGPAAPSAEALVYLHPLDHDQTVLDPSGWLGEWQARNAVATIPHVVERVLTGEAASNLARVVGDVDEPLQGMPFTDSDVYKILEAVAWQAPSLDPDSTVLRDAARLVELLERVQEPDGYLNSRVQGDPALDRYADPQWGHELYCAGHLFQAAVAASRTGSLPGLEPVARRFADHLVERFGPDGELYLEGHPEVETALVELYRQTGEQAYLDLAGRQLAQRGHGWLGEQQFGSAYFQDHRPVRDGAEATGHAVRQLYLLTGAVDVAVETGDRELLDAAIATWEDLFATKTYISGAHGSRHRDEAIGDPYELPADRAYAESCAAVASFQLSWRLLLATGEARYAEEMERVLYNAVAVSTGLDGTSFFYSNPLHLRTDHAAHEDAPSERLPWYACACCPPNIARLLATAHDYLSTTSARGIQLHHYSPATITTSVGDHPVTLQVTTAYPWDGTVTVVVDQVGDDAEWELALRVPSWCKGAELIVDGVVTAADPADGYVRMTRNWTGVREVRLTLPMPARLIEPHPRIDASRGCVAIARGPVLYAIEQHDLPAHVVLEDLRLNGLIDHGADDPDLAPVLLTVAVAHAPSRGSLYRDHGAAVPAPPEPLVVTAIPYHRWANRTVGAMRVWIPVDATGADQHSGDPRG